MPSIPTVFSVVFSLLAVFNLVGNTLVILVIVKTDSLKTPVNYLLVNLAFADMLVGIFFGAQFIVKSTLAHPHGTTGDLLCMFVTGGVLGWVGAVASVFSLVIIAIERYYAVMLPYTQRGKLTRAKIASFITVCWVLALLWAGPGFFITVYKEKIQGCGHRWSKEVYANIYTVGWTVVAGVVPIGTMACLYSRVVHRLWFTTQSEAESTQRSLLRHRRRVTKMVIAVTVMYVLCWVPELTIYFLGFTGTITLTEIHVGIASALVAFNSSVNPVLYSLQSSAFRKQLWELIFFVKFCRRNSVNPDMTETLKGPLDRGRKK